MIWDMISRRNDNWREIYIQFIYKMKFSDNILNFVIFNLLYFRIDIDIGKIQFDFYILPYITCILLNYLSYSVIRSR